MGWCYPRVCVLLSQTVSCQGELCPRFREVLRRAAASWQLSGPSRPRQFLNILRSHRGAGLGCLKAFYDVLSIELKVYICSCLTDIASGAMIMLRSIYTRQYIVPIPAWPSWPAATIAWGGAGRGRGGGAALAAFHPPPSLPPLAALLLAPGLGSPYLDNRPPHPGHCAAGRPPTRTPGCSLTLSRLLECLSFIYVLIFMGIRL